MKTNFLFLKYKWGVLSELGKMAEDNLYSDPNTTMIKLRMFAEHIVDYMFAYDKLEEPEENNLFNKLKLLERKGLIQDEILDILHSFRIEGNKAVHESFDSLEDAKTLLSLAHKAGIWFMQVYGELDYEPGEFILPDKEEEIIDKLDKRQKEYEKKINKVQEELAAIKNEQEKNTVINSRRKKSKKSSSKITFDEKENKVLGFFRGNQKDNSQKISSEYKFITTENIDYDSTKGRKKVWDSVKRSYSGRNCIAYWRFPIFSKRGEVRKEPDILIADKKQGLIALEVQECFIDDIKQVTDDYWQFMTDRDDDSPYYLVEDQLYAVKGLCESDRSLRSIEGRAALVVPNITGKEWEEKGFPVNNIIFADQLGKKTFFKKINKVRPVFGRTGISKEQWEALLRVLTGQSTFKEENQTQRQDNKTRGGVKAIIKESLHKVDMQQEVIGKTIPPGPQRIRGIAGSGKSVLLCQKVAHMHLKHPDWKIALVFFTRSLYDNTIREVNKWLSRFSNGEVSYDLVEKDLLQILHAWGAKDQPGFYREMCDIHGIKPLNAMNNRLGKGDPNEKLIKACKLFLEEIDKIKPVYDAILIDEAQDLVVDDERLKYKDKQPFYWLAYQALKPVGDKKEKRLIWAYDEAQSLNSLNIPGASQLFGDEPKFKRMVSGFHEGGIRKSEVMNKCYRTPGPVLTAAHAIGMGLLRPDGMLRGYTTQEDWENIGYEVLEGSFNPVGQKVVLHRPEEMTPNRVPEIWDGNVIKFENYNTRKQELNKLAKKVRHNIEVDGLNPSRDILVIVLGDSKESYRLKVQAARALQDVGIDIYIPKSLRNNDLYPKYPDINPDKFWNKGGVTVSNTYRAKGNEAYMVYVIGLDKIAEDESDFVLRNQLFVALTRTKGWLEVSGVGNFPLYEELNNVIESKNCFEFVFQRPLAGK